MGLTIIQPVWQEFPKIANPAIVEIKENWDDEWQFEPNIEPIRFGCFCSQDMDVCELQHRYARLKQPWAGDFSVHPAWGSGYHLWIRVLLLGEDAYEQAWIGRISSDTRQVHGSDVAPSGQQVWTAYGAADILRKISVSRSWWKEDGKEVDIGWVPSVNDFDERGDVIGNRDGQLGGTFVYGGEGLWSNYDYLEYLLKRFVDETAQGGPTWSIDGQADVLKTIVDVHSMGAVQTVSDILEMLIPTKKGLDYLVAPTDQGFAVRVFALSHFPIAFGAAQLPANPNTVEIKAGQTADIMDCRVERSGDQKYGRIRVFGNRQVACYSIHKDNEKLASKWEAADEAGYKAGTGNDNDLAPAHDEARRKVQFADVFQSFGMPDLEVVEAIELNALGEPAGGKNDNAQSSVRETLSWLPMLAGMDYTQNPPQFAGDIVEPYYIPPIVFIWHEALWCDGTETRYDTADQAGVGVSAPRKDWGIKLSAGPNHLLAHGHFDPFAVAHSRTSPEYNWQNLVATIACKTDQRVEVIVEQPNWKPSDGSLDIEVPDAELWFLCKDTSIKLDDNNQIVSIEEMKVVRNDSAVQLHWVMCGAIQRHFFERMRATMTVKGFHLWGGLLGQILTTLEDGGDVETIAAPITAVEWIGGDGQVTIVRTGFAEA